MAEEEVTSLELQLSVCSNEKVVSRQLKVSEMMNMASHLVSRTKFSLISEIRGTDSRSSAGVAPD